MTILLILVGFAGLWSGACYMLAFLAITADDVPAQFDIWVFIFAPIAVPFILLKEYLYD